MTLGYHVGDEIQKRSYDSHLMKRLLVYVRPYRIRMFFATVLLLIAAIFSTLVPYYNGKSIDRFINNPERVQLQQAMAGQEPSPDLQAQLDQQRQADTANLHRLVLVMALLIVGEALARYAQGIIVAYIGQKTMMQMRMGIFAHLQRMSLKFLDKNPVGRLMTRVTNDVEKIQETIVSGAVHTINDLFVIVFVLSFMFWHDWQLTLVTLSPIPFVFIVGLIFRKYSQTSFLEIRRRLAHLNAFLQENISGMRVVQIFRREAVNYQEYEKRNADHRDEWFKQIKYYAYYFPVIDFLGTLSLGFIILYGGSQLMHLQQLGRVADIGIILMYVQWSERLYGPVRALADRYNLILEAMASSERIFELLDTPEDIPDKPGAIVATNLKGHVEFKDVWFAYEPERWILKGINLTIVPGERVAVVGHTGAGKSTLINVLSRFYDIQRGSITIDGVDIRDYDKQSLRRNIGVVLQDVFLFSGTIEHNIRLGDGVMSDKEVHACAQHVNAADFIERLPGAYTYDVGERGCNISTGQRQLLAFARTLAHRPRVLVLDEATSSIDPETESLIQDAISKLMDQRTSIVIAHRLSTIQHADRIVVMHHGAIREMGTHQDLLAQRGLYYTLYRLQYREETPHHDHPTA